MSLGGIDRPLDSNFRIIERDAGVVLARIRTGDLVKHLGVGFERAKTMGETLRHPKLFARFRRQDFPDPLAEGRRTRPNIDGDVEDRPLETAYELALASRRRLVMQAADSANLARQRLVVLNERHVLDMFAEPDVLERLHEIPPVIPDQIGSDQSGASNVEALELHEASVTLT